MSKEYCDIYHNGYTLPAITISLNKLTRFSGNPALAQAIRDAGKAGDDGMVLVDYRHHSPYDGCFWETNYLVGKVEGNTLAMWPVFSANVKQLYAEDMYEAISGQSYRTDSYDFYPLDDDVADNIHYNALKTIHEILSEQFGYELSWHCDGLGEKTTEPPYEPSGYRGNGGIGVTLTGWYSLEGYEKAHVDLYGDGSEYILREEADINIHALLYGYDNDKVFSYHYDYEFMKDEGMVEIENTSDIPQEIVDTYCCIYAPRDSQWLTGNEEDGYGFMYNLAIEVRKAQVPLFPSND